MTDINWHQEIAPRLAAVRDRIARACREADRAPEDVHLIAVSKRKPVAAIRAAYALGLRDFGENYAQELRDKANELRDLSGIRWHFIGPLQRNKVRLIVGRSHWIHTIDRLPLIDALEARAARSGVILKLLLQLNLAGEVSKSGAQEADLPTLLTHIDNAPHLICHGLMTIPPAVDDPHEVAPYFDRLRELLALHGQTRDDTFRELSMGMSADLEVAIAAGATRVRVGTALFGPRDGP